MERVAAGFIQLELKYCERCGALWLRLEGSDLVFCGACAKAMAGMPVRAGVSVPDAAETSLDIEPSQAAFWGEGGHA